MGTEEVIGWGFDANNYPPVLHTHDARGQRIDEVRFHPAWHALMRMDLAVGLHNLPWREPRAGAQVSAGGAVFHVRPERSRARLSDLDDLCRGARPAASARRGGPMGAARSTAPVYDPRNVPADGKPGVLIGMAMTEKQGGSDVRANTSRAVAAGAGGAGQGVSPDGHKWFCSAPMCDAFLVLAQARPACRAFCCRAGSPTARRTIFNSSD